MSTSQVEQASLANKHVGTTKTTTTTATTKTFATICRLLAVGILLHLIVCTCAAASDTNELGVLRDGPEQQASVNDEQVPSALVPAELSNTNNNNGNIWPGRPASAKDRLLAVPQSLTRYFFPNMRVRVPLVEPAQTSAMAHLNDLKRSSSALDSLTGVTLPGKRSVGPYTSASSPTSDNSLWAINYEPMLTKQHSAMYMRTTRPRYYDMERVLTGPYVPYESQTSSQSDYVN